ncbi:MAG: hypothetical protein LBR68_00405 [Lachnoclostridium sp.]|nr:hypothetical protein [Lachnoclostridium sp.]
MTDRIIAPEENIDEEQSEQESYNTKIENMDLETLKAEYSQVTSYLKDIQLIDMAPEEDRKQLIDVADAIFELTKERNRLQKQKYKITDRQKNVIEESGESIEKDIRTLKDEESFLVDVKSDLGRLNREKKRLQRSQKESMIKQRTLKTLSKSMIFILMSLMILLYAVGRLYRVDISMGFIGIILFGFMISAFILYEVFRNRKNILVMNKKSERAVMLINRTKIKYVNSVKLIDYLCGKYDVRNGMELEFIHDQYLKMKKELSQQYASTKMLEEYHKALIGKLEKMGVKDREIWFFQAEALVNPKEMVEVRHHLNSKRQELRSKIEHQSFQDSYVSK